MDPLRMPLPQESLITVMAVGAEGGASGLPLIPQSGKDWDISSPNEDCKNGED